MLSEGNDERNLLVAAKGGILRFNTLSNNWSVYSTKYSNPKGLSHNTETGEVIVSRSKNTIYSLEDGVGKRKLDNSQIYKARWWEHNTFGTPPPPSPPPTPVLYKVNDKIDLVNEAMEWVKGNENPLTIQLPEGAVDGDIIIIVQGTSGPKPDPPSGGWTFIDGFSKSEDGNCSIYAYFKVYKEGIDTSYTYTKGNRKFASIFILRGINYPSPVKASATKKTAHSRMKIGESRETECPSVKGSSKGAVLVCVQYDDVVTIKKIVDSKGDSLYIISKNQRGDDGLISSIRSTSSGETGIHKVRFTSEDGGLVYAIGMTISLRPLK